MAFCGNCGTKVSEDFSFCSSCGAPLKKSTASSGNNTGEKSAKGFYHPEDIEKGKAMSALAYLWILFFLPLVVCPESKFGRFHANQGLVLLIFQAILGIIVAVLRAVVEVIYFGGWYGYYSASYSIIHVLLGLLSAAVAVISIIFIVIGIVNAVNGQAKELPVIGRFKLIK